MDKIFVQIASYRDPQLILTIDDMINRAKHPERLTFGICWQYDEEEDISIFDKKQNFRVKKYHYSESAGLGWARNVTNSLYDGEKYTLQIDSHHRFVDGWDEILIEDYMQSLEISEKPIITTYCTPFDPQECRCKYEKLPSLMSQYEFSYDKLLMSMPWYIQDYKERTKVIRARTISGHFYFVAGEFIDEVRYDPDIYFGGYTEETTLSVRAFTKGYDFFSPYRMIMWHEYTRNYRRKHWEDHGIESATNKTSGERDVYARNKTRQLFEQEDHAIDMGIYGLGTVRTLHDYEVYGGFDFKNCRIQEYTIRVKEPANPTDWENQFITKTNDINITWDLEFFKKQGFIKPKFMTLGLLTNSGVEVKRKDFTVENNPEIVNLEINQYRIVFDSIDVPKKIVMYLFDEDKQWSDRYEKDINV